MGTMSKIGLPTWTGNFGHWNPHVIRKPLNKVESKNPSVPAMTGMYARAVELLKAVPGTKSLFEAGIPLCPALLPKMSKLKKDDITLSKVGGLPNLGNNWLYNYHKRLDVVQPNKKHKKDQNQLEGLWPRCGVCHKYMSFVGQFDISDGWDAIHHLTCDKDKYGHFSYSGVGIGEGRTSFFWRMSSEWTFWACGNANEHYSSQNCDAHIWTENHIHFLGEEPDLEGRESAIKEATDDAANFCEEHKIKKLVGLQKVDGIDLRFDLDFLKYLDWKVQGKIEKVQQDNPDIFAWPHGRQFKMFGKPESQQEEARFFGHGNRCSEPYRMAPVLCWDDEKHDMTYQMYADLQYPDGESRHNFHAKVDASCT